MRCEGKKVSDNAVAEVGGVEVIRPVIPRHPCGGEVLLQHGNPTVFGADVQVFVIQNGIEFIFFVFRIRSGERGATESMHRGQATGLPSNEDLAILQDDQISSSVP